MFVILITSQIVNLKTIGDVLAFRKCYQCGNETLGPVVKHSVRDSRDKVQQSRIKLLIDLFRWYLRIFMECSEYLSNQNRSDSSRIL